MLLRAILVLLVAGTGLAVALLYVISLDLAAAYPRHAAVRLPLFLAASVTAVPVLVAAQALWAFLAMTDRGEAFSPGAVRLFRRIKIWFAGTAGYLLVVFVVSAVLLLPDKSPSVLLAWWVGEAVVIFVVACAAVLQRLFEQATVLRVDHELTV